MPLQIALGLVAGVAVVALTRSFRVERSLIWALIALPLIYAGFQIADGNGTEALIELAVGVAFIGAGIYLANWNGPIVWLAAGVFWLAHAVFDLAHDSMVDGAAVPDWYPAVCIGFDVAVGAYLIWRHRTVNRTHPGKVVA